MLTKRISEAFALAVLAGEKQVREGISIPNAAHPLGIASTTLEFGVDEDKAIASLLRDALDDGHLPRNGTAQGAALELLQNRDCDALNAVGVTIVEGEHPRSTYYAADLMCDSNFANKAAAAAGIKVLFKNC